MHPHACLGLGARCLNCQLQPLGLQHYCSAHRYPCTFQWPRLGRDQPTPKHLLACFDNHITPKCCVCNAPHPSALHYLGRIVTGDDVDPTRILLSITRKTVTAQNFLNHFNQFFNRNEGRNERCNAIEGDIGTCAALWRIHQRQHTITTSHQKGAFLHHLLC